MRRPPRRPRPWFVRPGRLRIGAVISLLVHVVIGLLLLVSVRHEQEPEALPPPSAVTMLFDSGSKTGPTLPQPQPDTLTQPAPAPQAEPALPVPPQPPAAEALPPVQPAPAPTVEAPAVQPAPPAEAPPAVQPPPVVEAPPPATEEPKPQPPAEKPVAPSPEPVPLPPAPAPFVPVPPPAEPAPKAVPQPPSTPPSHPSPPKPLTPAQAQAKPAPPSKAPNFPPPMNFSLGSPPRPRPQPTPHPPGTIDLSLGPAKQGPADNTPHAMIDGDKAGPDWRNALSLWVSQHAYYPEQARENHEEGEARVHVEATSRGRVTSVELLGKSGSMWLDLALQALFRNANIPPLPGGHTEPIEFNFTMRYILRYR